MPLKNDDDLTTDAMPTPPRDEHLEETEDIGKDNEESQFTEKAEPTIRQTKFKTRSKARSKEPANIASMINISNSRGIHIGTSKVINISVGNVPSNANVETITKNGVIVKLLSSEDLVSRDHISFVSGHIGEGWRDVARTLQFSEGQIDQFYENYNSKGIKEVLYQLLLDWIQNEPTKCTLGRLGNSLWDNKQRDAVKRLAEYLY